MYGGNSMEKVKTNTNFFSEDDIGFILWKIESLEKFYPCYNSIIKEE